jgi:hypothetical protein
MTCKFDNHYLCGYANLFSDNSVVWIRTSSSGKNEGDLFNYEQTWAISEPHQYHAGIKEKYISVGCYHEAHPRDIALDEYINDSMTLDICSEHCSSKVQNLQKTGAL